MLQQITSKTTTKDPVGINVQIQGQSPILSASDKVLLSNIMERYNAMRSARIPLDRLWQIAQLQFESMYIPYADGRARSNVPLEWAIIELFVAEAINRPPKVDISAIIEDSIPKVEPMRRVMDFVDKGYIKEQLYRNEYITSIYGTGYYLTALKEDNRVIRDIDYSGDEEVITKKMLTNNKCIIKALDPRFVYLDDRTNDFEDDVDQIFIDYITPEKLLSLKNNKSFKNIDQVSVTNKSDIVFFTKEDRGKLSNNVVELMHYFNKESDQYVVVANRSVIIKECPNPYAHKELPIVPRPYAFNPMSKMGRGLCEALVNFKSQINQMNEMIMDGIRRSNNSLFVVGNGLTFDGNSFGFNNTLIKANGKLGPENFQEIRGQQPNSAIFQFSQDVLRQVAIYVGIDPSSIIGQASSTAFETAVRQESSLKRVNVVLTNRDIALQKVYERHIANIQQFFPRKIAKGLSGIQDITQAPENFPVIMLEGEKYINGEFVKFEGKFPFEVKPDYIRGQYDIKVETNFNSPTLKQLRLQRYQDFVRTANEYSMAIQNNPAMAQAIPIDDFITEMAQEFDIDVSSLGGAEGSVAKEKKDLMQKIQMLTGTETPAGMEQGQESGIEEPQEQGVRQKIGGIMTPNTPNINNTSPAVKGLM